jgi:hypothetical protein
MLELASKGFPYNDFYALDMRGVIVEEVEAFLQDGLRNFKSRVDCRTILIRTGLAEKPEVKLYLTTVDASDDSLILSKMKEALAFISKKFGGYSNCFIILQEWTPEEDYLYSLNLMPMHGSYIFEIVKGNHRNIDRLEKPPTILKMSPSGINILKHGLRPDELTHLQRQLKQLLNNHFFDENCVYEFSLLREKPTFYQIKRPGALYKHPISKDKFYETLKSKSITFESKILRK